MSGQLGDLVISLSADIARFQSDMGKSAKIANDTAKQMVASFDAIPAMFGKIGVAAATVGGVLAGGAMFKDMISTTKEVSGEVVKLSKVFGTNAEQASILRIALDDAFLTVDDAVGASDRLTNSARKNSETFKKVGIDVRNSNGDLKDSMSIMMEVNDYLLTLKEGKERDTAAMALYGKGWREFSGILRLTTEGLKDAKDRAEALHLVFGEDKVKSVKEYRMAMKDIGDVSESFKVQIGQELIPVLTDLAVAFGDAGLKAAGLFAEMAKGAKTARAYDSNWFRRQVARIPTDKELVAGGWDEYNARQSAADAMYQYNLGQAGEISGAVVKAKTRGKKGATGTAPDLSKDGADKEKEWITAWNSMQDKIRELDPFVDEHAKAIRKMDIEYETLTGKFPEHRDELNKNKETYRSWLEYIKTVKDEVAATSSEFKALFDEWEKTPPAPDFRNFMTDDQVKDLASIQGRIDSIKAGTANEYGFIDPMKRLEDQYQQESAILDKRLEENRQRDEYEIEQHRKLLEEKDALDQQYQRNRQILEKDSFWGSAQAVSAFGTKIAGLMMQGNKKQFEEGKKLAMAMATIDGAAAMVKAQSAASPPYNYILMGVSAGLTAVQIAQISAQQYEGREFGGPVNAGQTYVVGEKRPELFTPSTSGHITPYVPNGKTVHLTQVIQVSTGVSDTVRAEIANYAPVLAQMAVSAVRADIEGGGDMARAVGRV